MSAGLGLVADTASVPAYDLTLSPMAASMIQRRVRGTFDAPAWWKRMQAGPYANDLAMLSGGNGRILVALTQPYAALCGAALAQLPKEDIHRLRLFGGGLKAHLPATLHANILPYDARLDALVPGTRLNFAARALAHFATLLQDAPQDAIETDCARVERALASEIRPTSCVRTRATDDELLCRIGGFIRRGLSAPAALRELRSCAGVACEERRFRRLFQQARA